MQEILITKIEDNAAFVLGERCRNGYWTQRQDLVKKNIIETSDMNGHWDDVYANDLGHAPMHSIGCTCVCVCVM